MFLADAGAIGFAWAPVAFMVLVIGVLLLKKSEKGRSE